MNRDGEPGEPGEGHQSQKRRALQRGVPSCDNCCWGVEEGEHGQGFGAVEADGALTRALWVGSLGDWSCQRGDLCPADSL